MLIAPKFLFLLIKSKEEPKEFIAFFTLSPTEDSTADLLNFPASLIEPKASSGSTSILPINFIKLCIPVLACRELLAAKISRSLLEDLKAASIIGRIGSSVN